MHGIKRLTVPDWVLLGALLLTGGFHEYVSCAVSVVLSLYLIMRMARSKALYVQLDAVTLAVTALCAGYGFSCFWAVDRGMAWIGFVKFLPLLLYTVSLRQEENGRQVLTALPYAVAAVAVLAVIGMHIPAVSSLFSVAGRLAGVFQYPNTFALFLLVSELLLLKAAPRKWYDIATLVVLLGGLLYTGSRTVFVLAVAANAVLLSVTGGKRRRIAIVAVGVLGIAGVLGAAFLLPDDHVLSRYLTITLSESTFVGRLLYMVDALPLLLKYPFGMGYMGYSYIQGSIQTGVYSVTFVHNDLLQIALDAGWIPCLLLLAAVGVHLFSKDVCRADKVIVATFAAHCLFDFDLQFLGMFMLLILLLYRRREHVLTVKRPLSVLCTAAGVIGAVSLYMGAALLLPRVGCREAAQALYPFNTQNKLMLLKEETDVTAAHLLADEILLQNKACYVPYSINAAYAFSVGDFAQVIENKRAAIERAPFEYQEYETYAVMLIQGIEAYDRAGDTVSAAVCREELLNLQQMLSQNTARLSTLGSMIVDQPITAFSEDIAYYIEQLEKSS